jgi:hypothetical protein
MMCGRYLSIKGSKADSVTIEESLRLCKLMAQRFSPAVHKKANNWTWEEKCKGIFSMFDRVGLRTNIMVFIQIDNVKLPFLTVDFPTQAISCPNCYFTETVGWKKSNLKF